MSKKQQECVLKKTSIGGQALIEGIMMRGPDKQAIVCRKVDSSLVNKIEGLKPTPKIPFIPRSMSKAPSFRASAFWARQLRF